MQLANDSKVSVYIGLRCSSFPIETLTLLVALKKQALYLFSHCAYYWFHVFHV